MKKLLIAAVIVLALGLGASIYFCITLNQDKNALTADLNSTQNVLASTQAELTSTQTELASTQTELATTKDSLATSQTELGDTKDTLTSTLDELGNTRETLASTESELDTTNQQLTSKLAELSTANDEIDSLQDDLADLQDSYTDMSNLLDISQATLTGLGITVDISDECRDVKLIDNPEAENPTWSELISFLATDQTDRHEYILNEYDCSQFSRDVHNNAEAAGIRAAEVQVAFRNAEAGHALNAFITTDYGLVYIDCTEAPDTVARIKLDKDYRAVETSNVLPKNVRNDLWWDALMPYQYYYIESDWIGHAIVSDIMIYW